MREELHYLSLIEASRRMRSGALSPVQLTEALLDRISQIDPVLTSYITVSAEYARSRARQAEEEMARGLWRGPLHGIPLAVKDLVDTKFAPTTGGMTVRSGENAADNATVVERLEAAGAVLLGKLAMTEGAYAFHHPALPTPTNPWASERWPGASSSGSGVATAAGLCFGSLGSDTGGSIRLPSSSCGLTGLKPTWGRVSRHGVVHLSESMDHIGPMARTAADAAAILQAIAGADPRDPTALHCPAPDYLRRLHQGVSGMEIGIDRTLLAAGVDPQVAAVVEAAAEALESRGARIRAVAMPSSDAMLEGWTGLCAVEARLAHRDTFPARRSEYGEALAQMLDGAAQVSAGALAATGMEIRRYAGRLTALFDDVDMVVMPVTPFTTPMVTSVADIMAQGVPSVSRFMAPFDMTGHPTLTLQGGFDRDHLPIGFQLVGRPLEEDRLLAAGHVHQQVTDWHTMHPAL